MRRTRLSWTRRRPKTRDRNGRKIKPQTFPCPLCDSLETGFLEVAYPWPCSRADDDRYVCCKKCGTEQNLEALARAKARGYRKEPKP